MVDLKTLLSRYVDVSDTKQLDKIFIFDNINSISEFVLQKLLFRLENYEPNSAIYINVTKDLDEKVITDTMYGSYSDEDSESKAMDIALRYSDSFSTPIRLVYSESGYAKNIHMSDDTAVIHINTLGIERNFSNGLVEDNENTPILRPYNRRKKDLYIDGMADEDNLYVNLLYSNPDIQDHSFIMGEAIPTDIRLGAVEYMESELPNAVQDSLTISTTIFNVINSFLTEGMKLEFSRSVINKETLQTTYSYFNRKVPIYARYGINVNSMRFSLHYPEESTQIFEEYIERQVASLNRDTPQHVQDVITHLNAVARPINSTYQYLMREITGSYSSRGFASAIPEVYLARGYSDEKDRLIFADAYHIVKEFSKVIPQTLENKQEIFIQYVMFTMLHDLIGGNFKWQQEI